MKISIVYYSLYGHTHRLAEAVAEGVNEVKGADLKLYRIPETLSEDALNKKGALEAQKEIVLPPTCTLDDLASSDAIIFGAPTYLGCFCGQMHQFMDSTGPLWEKNALVGKVGSVFTSTGSQHGGQEAALLSFHTTLLHHGMIIVGLPYTFVGQRRTDEITGGTPYGASTVVGTKGERWPSQNELDGAKFQGKYVAEIAAKLCP